MDKLKEKQNSYVSYFFLQVPSVLIQWNRQALCCMPGNYCCPSWTQTIATFLQNIFI